MPLTTVQLSAISL